MSKKMRQHKKNIRKSGKTKFIDKIIDSKTGCVIIIKSCDPNLRAEIFKER